jgi:hypothetical protein
MFKTRVAGWAALFALGISTAATAHQPPVTGLGQSWPNTTDVSASPRWHVYMFVKDGIRYVQVNDLSGRVRGAFASAGSQFLVLPMGVDEVRTAIGAYAAEALAPAGEVIYSDSALEVIARSKRNGITQFSVICTDPVECSTHIQSPVKGTGTP